MHRPASRWRHAGVAGVFALLAMAPSCEAVVNLNGLEGGCPPARGATQVKVTSGATPFCIDATETTNAQYAAFVASGFTLASPPTGCEALTGSVPSQGWPYQSGYDDFPVVYVNWCQAYAYCAWAGKHLCGQIPDAQSDGGALAVTSFDDPTQSEWLNACTQGGALTYPYGKTFDAMTCGGQLAGSMLAQVGSRPACVGPLAGLFDMSGNVWEWTNACGGPMGTPPSAANAFCDAMGGAFDSNEAELACVGERNWTRNSGAGNIGIRCCLDL